jgi:uncharacterized phiE125 gp8 family phage protein
MRERNRIMYSKVTVEPSGEPVSLLDIKKDLRVDHDEEDGRIGSMIISARQTIEQYTNSSLITQTRVLKLDAFPACETIYLPNGPVQSVTSISYVDEDGNTQNLVLDTDYYADFDSKIARLEAVNFWPATKDRPNAVTITYVCGYGSASAVPSPLKSALSLLVGHLYENREQVVDGNMMELPFGVHSLISSYVIEQPATYYAYRTPR